MIRVLAIDLDGTLLRSDILPTHKRMGVYDGSFHQNIQISSYASGQFLPSLYSSLLLFLLSFSFRERYKRL